MKNITLKFLYVITASIILSFSSMNVAYAHANGYGHGNCSHGGYHHYSYGLWRNLFYYHHYYPRPYWGFIPGFRHYRKFMLFNLFNPFYYSNYGYYPYNYGYYPYRFYY